MRNIVLFVLLCFLIISCKPHTFEGTRSGKKDTVKTQEVTYTANRLSIEIPDVIKDRAEEILFHEGFTISYNGDLGIPNWVAWELTDVRADGKVKKSSRFYADSLIQRGKRVDWFEYRDSPYERGHMCPAADCKYSYKSMTQSNLMSNICPQTHELNNGGWRLLEEKCRNWVHRYKRMYIVCGPIIDKGVKYETIGKNDIAVPKQYFKVILRFSEENKVETVGFIFNNDNTSQRIADHIVTVDSVENRTGFNFYPSLTKEQELSESVVNMDAWYRLLMSI